MSQKGFRGNPLTHALNSKGIPNARSFSQAQPSCGQVRIGQDVVSITDGRGVEIRHWEKEDWQNHPGLVPKMVDDSIKASHCSLPEQTAFSESQMRRKKRDGSCQG